MGKEMALKELKWKANSRAPQRPTSGCEGPLTAFSLNKGLPGSPLS